MTSERNEYYRIIVDFAITPEEWRTEGFVEKLFERFTEAILPVLDEEHEEGQPCNRDWLMMGKQITDAWYAESEEIEEAVVASFKQELDLAEDILKDDPPQD